MADEPLTPVEFEPEEASASYRVDPSAPSEFRFASSPSTLTEDEEEWPLKQKTTCRQSQWICVPKPARSLPHSPLPPGYENRIAEPETDFEDLEED